MPKPVLISGIRPTGKLHLGNYLGGLKNFVDLQNSDKYQCYFFIADLHSLDENFNPKEKPQQILDVAADYLAAGLNPKKSIIFVQSQIPAHSELAWILNTITPLGELERMTQFKEKSEAQKNNINLGLLAYPVLMAADILLYDAQFVPVGEDQLQHLELTHTLARKFNNKFGQTFVEPKALLTKASRIMSLTDPMKKMSKSQPNGCLFLDDSPKVIQEKLSQAVTDSGHEIKYEPQNKSAISNLLTIYAALTEQPIKILEEKYAGQSYAEFKKDLAKVISDSLKTFQKEKKSLTSNKKYLQEILEAGNQQAREKSQAKLLAIKEKIGLI